MNLLTIDLLKKEAKIFSKIESNHKEKSIYGSTDGKAVGTYLEHKFQNYLKQKYIFEIGNSASGIDFPELGVDIKVTSYIQPQSSCPFKSARQKVYGLGYSLLIFVYQKKDNHKTKKAHLNILHAVFVDSNRTGDFQLTSSIIKILDNNGNKDDLLSLFTDKNLPLDDITSNDLAEEILKNKPFIGYLTISNALQWRLQYSRVIENASKVEGIYKII